MADMVDAGVHTFKAWARQTPSPATGVCWYNRWLGEFNPELSADEANKRLDHVGKITLSGQEQFKRGWERAQSTYAVAGNLEYSEKSSEYTFEAQRA